MEGYCPFNQKMFMMSYVLKMTQWWKCIKWWKGTMKGEEKEGEEKRKEEKKQERKKKRKRWWMEERKNPFWTAARQWPTKGGRHTVLCCFWCPINIFKKYVYELFMSITICFFFYLAVQLQMSSCVFMNISVQTSIKESPLSRYTLIFPRLLIVYGT